MSAFIIGNAVAFSVDGASAKSASDPNHEVQLEQLSVTGQGGPARNPDGYATARSVGATRTDTPLREVPQTVVPVTRQVLEDAAATRIDTALDLAGVGRSNNFAGLGLTEVTIRGFSVFDYYRNGFPLNRGYPNAPDIVAIERIEVLKGPSAFLYGRGDPGGTFNIVTKQPLAERSLTIGTQFGSYGAKRSTIDATGALDETGQILGRLTGAVEDNGSFRDFVSGDRYHLAPVLAWTPSADTTVTLEGAFVSTGTTFDRGIVPLQGRLRAVPRSRFLSEPGLPPSRVQDALGQVRIEHRFDRDWILTAGAQMLGGRLESWGVGAAANGLLRDGRTLRRNLEWRDLHWSDTDLQINLAGRFETGFLHHTLLLGLEYDRFRYREIFDRSNAAPYPFLLDLLAPRYGQALPRSVPAITDFLQHTDSYAGYVQDQIDITPRLHALLGVRVEDAGQDSTSSLTNRTTTLRGTEALPRFGLVYDLTDAVSVYGNYARSFKPSTASDRRGQPLAFEGGEGYEAGVKVGLLDGRLNATAAVFDIRRTHVPTTDPIDSAFSVATGVVQSRGFDLSVAGALATGLQVIGTYTHVDAAVARDTTLPVGTRLANVPANSLAVQAVYEVQGGALTGLGFGGGLDFVGKRAAGTALSTFTMPGYTVVNLISYYQITPGVRVYLNVDNLLDATFYDRAFQNRYATPGQPRTVIGGVSARF